MAIDQRSAIQSVPDRAGSDQPEWAWAILDSLDAQLAVIDHTGLIRYVNAAWVRSASEGGGDLTAMGVGSNYLAVCPPDILSCLQAILNGESEHFEYEYECGLPVEERWYIMRGMPLVKPSGWAVITHHNITRGKRVASDKLEAARQQEDAREQDSLLKLSGLPPTPVTAQSFGLRSLRESSPEAFDRFIDYYGDLLDHAVQARSYKGLPPIQPRLKVMADQLVFLKAGPRDVIEIHLAVVRLHTAQASAGEVRAYTEEARLLILELMGHLVATYRSQAFGIKLADA